MSCGTGSSRSGRSVEQGAQLLGRHCTQGLGQGAWPLVLTQRRHHAYLPGRSIGRRMCGFGFEASIDDDQCGDEQHPADQQRPLTDESPPLAEVSTDDRASRGRPAMASTTTPKTWARRTSAVATLTRLGEANTDAEEDRRQDIDQTADDQAHAETRCCGVENTSRGYSRGLLRLWTGGSRAEPARCTGRWERSRWMRFFRSEQQWAGRVVDKERPMSGARLT